MISAFDFETFLIGPQALAPEPVCLSSYTFERPTHLTAELTEEDEFELSTSADRDMRDHLGYLVSSGHPLVAANAQFDLGVMTTEWPELMPGVFRLLEEGLVKDVQIREKLLNLAEFGELAFTVMPDGSKRRFIYSLESLCSKYLGIELKKATAKKGDSDAWRLNYDSLVGVRLHSWPEDAVNYAIADSAYTGLIYYNQELRRAEITESLGMDPLATEDLRVATSFCLHKMSMHGMRIDPVEHGRIREHVAQQLVPERLNLLVEEGILVPASPPKPYARNARAHVEGCEGPARKTCDCPPKMTKGTKESVSKKTLRKFVMGLSEEEDIFLDLQYTAPTEKFPEGQLRIDKEFLDDHYHLSPVLGQFRHRASLQKLVTTDLPRLEWPKGSGIAAPIVHPCYDVLKETGRTSSYASANFPSMNGQNPHPEIRGCIVPRDGYVLMSVDYSGMELGSLAQTCLNLFGYSVLADKINAGCDAHAYLGAQLAYYLDGEFHQACSDAGVTETQGIYEAFVAMKTSEREDVRKIFKHYRTFAKPTGLGYPGGLGPATFVGYAHATYKIEVDEDLAIELRKVWKTTFPEMADYLKWVNSQKDPNHHGAHSYSTPLGMYRANCSYCACANGMALQSPSAEGAIMAVCNVVSETFLPGSVLSDDDKGPRHRPIMFIHDEIVSEVRVDVAHEVAQRVSEIMVDAMRLITPDVAVKAEPCLMTRWNKGAKAIYENGRLVPWEPKETK